MAEVEVDTETGEVTVLSLKSAYEVGRALNPKMVEQQIVGGAWMGMSHALYETTEPYYPDRAHGPVDFNEYLMPGPGDLPEFEGVILERPAPDGPYGAKGVGEMTANSPIPAIANAIFDAVGVRVDSLPITPEKVLRGILAKNGAAAPDSLKGQKSMLKVLSLMKRKEGMSYAEFRNWALNEHPQLATKIPGMRGYRMNVPREGESRRRPTTAISEMWWDSDEARARRLGTDAGQGGRRRRRRACASRFHFMAEEKVFI